MRPYSPIPRFVRGGNHAGLITRLIRSELDADICRVDLITTTSTRISLIDTGSSAEDSIAEGDTVLHCLWQAHEPDADVRIEGDRLPWAPGDSLAIPAGDSWLASANQLLVSISRRESTLALPLGPFHGDDHFSGHNRETRPTGMGLSRWKLTEPLRLAAAEQDRVLVSLYADLAIRWNGGVTMLRQGEASVIRPETGKITLLPNGLSYILDVR